MMELLQYRDLDHSSLYTGIMAGA
ncbi:hypothetical protein DFAR_2530001 [Desulfarculales bacterium]